MPFSIKASGVYTEPRLKGWPAWSQPIQNTLEIEEQSLRFGDLEIAVDAIENALLNKERIWFKTKNSLLFHSSGFKYQFYFLEPLPETFELPFKIDKSSNQSFSGLFLNAVGLFVIAWLALQVLGAIFGKML